jgi:flavocytochrome c
VEPDNPFGDTVDLFRQDTKLGGNQEVQQNPLLERLVVDSWPAFKWLRDRAGFKLDQVGQLGGHSKPRTHRPEQGMAGSELVFGLHRMLKDYLGRGLTIQFESRLTSLLTDQANRVTGVVYTHNDGSRGELLASEVVMATGGFAAGQAVLGKYRPDLLPLPTSNGRWATGDGHVAVEAIGGNVVDMDDIQVHPTGFLDPANPKNHQKFLCAELLRGVGAILLNSQGKRFCNELGTRDYIVAKMKEQSSIETSLVMSEHMAAFAPAHVPFYTSKGLLRKVNLAGLAKELNMSEEEVRTTLTVYNTAANEKKDTFGKKFFNNGPFDLDSGFYVGTVVPVVHYCIGGIRVDVDGRVLKATNETIPGLWAAGEAVGGIHGTNRLGGNALTECVVFGRAVGTAIAVGREQAPSQTHTSQAQPALPKHEEVVVTQAELQNHDHAGSIWVNVLDKVYDLTAFAPTHPGGFQSVVDVAGKNATDVFLAVHSLVMLEDFTPVGKMADSRYIAPKELATHNKRYITPNELATHNNKQSAWINVFDKVYDFTAFAKDHPGGEAAMLEHAGKNATKVYLFLHSPQLLDDFIPIGIMSS